MDKIESSFEKLYIEDIESVLEIESDFSKFKDKSILITGATGLIGTVLVDMLLFLNKKFNLNLYLLLISRNNSKKYPECVKILNHDINFPIKTDRKFDFIIHAASNTHPKQYADFPVSTITTNIIGTYNLLEMCRENPKTRFVLLSSVEIYGENLSEDKHPFKETEMGYLDCNTLRAGYCESKRVSESLCQAYKEQYGIEVLIPRLCRVYGPTLKKDDSKVLSQFLRNALENQDIVLKSDGNQYYSYIYSSDAAAAIIKTMLDGKNGEAYNIADSKSNIKLKDLAHLVSSKAEKSVIFKLPETTEAKGYSKSTVALLDSEKINNLGWKPKYTIEEGVERTLIMLKSKI